MSAFVSVFWMKWLALIMYVEATDVTAKVRMTTVRMSVPIWCGFMDTPRKAMTIENSLTCARLIAGTRLLRSPSRSV